MNSNMQESVTASTLLKIKSANVYEVKQNRTTLIDSGPLLVLTIFSMNVNLIQVNSFRYTLSKEIPILISDKNNKLFLKSYVLPSIEGHYILNILEASDPKMIESFETFLEKNCSLHQSLSDEQNMQVKDEISESEQLLLEERKNNQTKEKKTKTEIASEIIVKGGDIAKKGLIKGAELVSKGINAGGNYIQKKFIKKTEEADVHESTINKIKAANTVSNAAVVFSKAQVQGLVAVGKVIGEEAGKKWDSSEAGQKFKNYKHYGTVKAIGKSSVYFGASVIEGMFEAVCIIGIKSSKSLTLQGKELGSTTTKLVSKRYGEKAGEATKESLEAIGNVGQYIKIAEVEGTKAIKEAVTDKK